jgi:hypothetical protein
MAIYGSSVFASSATFCSVQSSRGIGVRLQCSCAGCLIMRRPGPCYDYGCSCAIYICVKYWMGVCCLRGSGTSKFPSIKYICKHANRRSCLVFTFRLSRVRRCTTVRSTSGPPDGRSTGCLASHTSGCTVRLLHCRSIDERTRWATFSADLLSGQSTSRDHDSQGSGRPLHRLRARLTAGAPAVWHHTRQLIPYGAHTAGRSTSRHGGRPP